MDRIEIKPRKDGKSWTVSGPGVSERRDTRAEAIEVALEKRGDTEAALVNEGTGERLGTTRIGPAMAVVLLRADGGLVGELYAASSGEAPAHTQYVDLEPAGEQATAGKAGS